MITTAVTIIARALRQPLVVGYIVSGIVVGPYLLDILHSAEEIEFFSKIGISVLLFIVGLSLNPEVIRETGKASLISGIGQVVFTALIGCGIALLLGLPPLSAFYVAIALTFSSTIIILKLLSDRGDLGKLYAKLSIGILLVQDLIASILLIVVPLLGASTEGDRTEGSHPFLFLTLSGIGAGFLLYGVSKYLLPKLSFFIARSQELLFLFSIAWGLGLAALFAWLGFSIEIGALIAGITLSVSSYAFEISSRMRPLRDFFIILFFVLLGSQVAVADLGGIAFPALVLSLFVLIGNPLIVFLLMNLMGYRSRTAFMTGLTLAQISEFSLILMSLGLSLGHITTQEVSLVTLVGLVTIAASTYLILHGDALYQRLRKPLRFLELRRTPRRESGEGDGRHDMIIFGYGRVGYEFVRTARELAASYLVVDYDPRTIAHLRGEEIPFRFGDAEDIEFLDEIELGKASVVVSTIPDPNVNILLVRHYRRTNPDGIIVVVSHNIAETRSLYLEGASYVVMPHYLGAEKASGMIASHWDDPATFERARNEQLSHMTEHEQRNV
jgi:Kef-type K+ transport system membrane component KefB